MYMTQVLIKKPKAKSLIKFFKICVCSRASMLPDRMKCVEMSIREWNMLRLLLM